MEARPQPPRQNQIITTDEVLLNQSTPFSPHSDGLRCGTFLQPFTPCTSAAVLKYNQMKMYLRDLQFRVWIAKVITLLLGFESPRTQPLPGHPKTSPKFMAENEFSEAPRKFLTNSVADWARDRTETTISKPFSTAASIQTQAPK